MSHEDIYMSAAGNLLAEWEREVIQRERARLILLVNQATPELLTPRLEEAILSGARSLDA